MATEKKYAKGMFVNEMQTKYGIIINLNVKSQEFISFIEENTNEKGYCNLSILRSKQGSKNSHYVILNEYKKD